MLKSEEFYRVLRFGVVGVIATAIHYGVYYFLLGVMNENAAYSIGFFVSFLCNFVLSSLFTFKVPMTWKRLLRFSGSHAGNYIIQIVVLNFWLWVGVPAEWAPIPVYAVSVPASYLLVRIALIYAKVR